MVIKRFRVSNRKNDAYVRVWIYDDIDHLRKDAENYDKKSGFSPSSGYYEDALGITHSYRRESFKNGEESGIKRDIGLIRMATECLSTEVVAHELTHAAFWNYRLFYGDGNANFGDAFGDFHEEEEEFAHLYGQMFRDMTKKLYRYGLWK